LAAIAERAGDELSPVQAVGLLPPLVPRKQCRCNRRRKAEILKISILID